MLTDVILGYAAGLTKDVFTKSAGNTVTITCNNRGDPVQGILAAPLKLNVSAEYKDFLSVGNVNQLIEAGDAVVNALSGTTIKQPWFSRKYWSNTAPLQITATLAFIAQNDAKAEVFDPVQRLIGYCYPRELNAGDKSLAKSFMPPGPNLFSGKADGSNEVVGGIIGAEKRAPDYVTFDLGAMVSLEMCYLRNVQPTFSSALDSDGFPHSATVSILVEAFDASYWPADGNFTLTQKAGLAFNVDNVIDTVKQKANDMKASASSFISRLTGGS